MTNKTTRYGTDRQKILDNMVRPMEYTKIGTESNYKPKDIERESKDLKWIDLKAGISLPMVQGDGIKSIIKEFKLPKVTKIAIHGCIHCQRAGESFNAGLYGILAHYRNETRELYFADDGCEIVPLGSRIV